MTAQAFAPGTMFGISAALTTNTTMIGPIVGIDTPPEMSREAIDTTHSGSTNGWMTCIPGNKLNPGEIAITCQYSTQLDYSALFLAGCDTITITFPKRATTCGASLPGTAASWSSACVMTKVSPKWEFESLAVVTLTFKLSGAPTYTAAAV